MAEPEKHDAQAFPQPTDDEQPLTRVVDWSKEEEAKAKRKYAFQHRGNDTHHR